MRTRFQEWYIKNREAVRARCLRNHHANKERNNERQREWYHMNHEAFNLARKCGVPIAKARAMLRGSS